MQIYYMLLAVLLSLSACSKAPETGPEPVTAEKPKVAVALPAYPDIAGLSILLANGDSSSMAIVDDALSKVGQFAQLNAFISLDSERAVNKANQLDQLRASGKVLGPLHGIPLVVKDNIHVAGMQNTAGTPGLKGFVPTRSNIVVERLEAAGAIILGKTNLHELAFGITSDNAAFGAVRNPYDESLIPGGSSGGTAVAISAGIVAAGLGTDTGGSVRIPPSLTGIVGFRPSMGRYPSEAVTPISETRDTVGLLSRTVADLTAYLEKFATGVSFEELTAAAASPDVRGVLGLVSGEGKTSEEVYTAALSARELLRKNFQEYFTSQQLDAIIFPTTILPARPIEGSLETVELNGEQVPTLPTYIHNTDPASIAALPGISLPVGLTVSGLPVGMEIDGPEQSDRRLLGVAVTLEAIVGFSGRPPR